MQKFKVDNNVSDMEKLAAFFDRSSQYSIKIYDRESLESGTSSHLIRFDFLSKVAEVLHQSNLEGRFVSIFGENPLLSNSPKVEEHL